MLTAVLIACLISEPTKCRPHEMLLEASMPTAAYIEAQTRAAEWLLKHPDMKMIDLHVVNGRGA